ncbi:MULTISPECIES: O-antigen ligase family protein [unclassified Luteococcus]|uniref:O-antigen ligase family protein n=1 Tax=unclassified Luteococcus TaxID=2639923 RepID=UPI00313C9F94
MPVIPRLLLPRLRLTGPIERRDATLLLTLAGALITARVPMSFLALLGLPAVVIAVQGWRRGVRWPLALRRLLAWCAGASLVSVLVFVPQQLPSTANNFVVILAAILMAGAVFSTGRMTRAADRLLDGLYLGLLLTWAISVFEAVTGFKFISVLYPGGNTTAAIVRNRFYVSAFFPNYNDYSVAMVLLCTVILAKLVFQHDASLPVRLGRWAILGSAAFFITHMGSRGCLLGLAAATLVILALSVRTLRPRAIRERAVFCFLLVCSGGAVGLALSPWMQDNSNFQRVAIAQLIGKVLAGEPVRTLIGFGSYAEYTRAAGLRFTRTLMDPHNLLIEVVLWYGLPALAFYLACWWTVVHRGLLTRRPNPGWRAVSAVTVTALYPLLGVVTSSTLRYHLVWLWLIVAMAHVRRWHLAERAQQLAAADSAQAPAAVPARATS